MRDIEKEICARYESELAEIAALDRVYYLNVRPTSDDRADYSRRQSRLEQVRAQFYADLSTLRYGEAPKPETFRVLVNDRVNGGPVMSRPQCTLAHDLNNHLGVLIGRCELLAAFVSNDAEASKQLSAVQDAAHKMAARIHGSVCAKIANLPILSCGASSDLETTRPAPPLGKFFTEPL